MKYQIKCLNICEMERQNICETKCLDICPIDLFMDISLSVDGAISRLATEGPLPVG